MQWAIHFFFYKNHVYKNVEAQIGLKFKNIVVILLVASLSLSQPQMRFRRSYEKKRVYMYFPVENKFLIDSLAR